MPDELDERRPMPPEVGAQSEITVYEDGPYLVRGAFVVRGQDGTELEFTRRTIALCRCGKSRMRPICDGTHRLIRFRAPGFREPGRHEDAQRRDESG